MNTRILSISTRMQHPLGMLIVIMLWFVVNGFHLGLFLRQVATSLTINLTFGICVLNNGEVSWSMHYYKTCPQSIEHSIEVPFKL
jgi:hypothetical protein